MKRYSTYYTFLRLSMAFMLSLMCVLTAQGAEPADTIATPAPEESPETLLNRRVEITDEEAAADSIEMHRLMLAADSVAIDTAAMEPRMRFVPNPSRAVWLSALFPGLGQAYNRRYWKLPIVVGGFLGITYALNWNNRMLGDYTRGYRDLTDNDPNTNSYKEFFHSTVDVNSLDKAWLEKTFKAKKDFYRRNRDLSIICMVGMYLLCMVDAYLDASPAQFDVSSDLSMNVSPQIIAPTDHSSRPSFGVQWSLNF